MVSGKVFRAQSDTSAKEPLAGLRLLLTQKDGGFSKELRTFSDGGFYSMEVPPGRYRLAIDSTQLEFLDVQSNPPERNFTVESRAQGDFVEKLNFTVTPRRDTVEAKKEPVVQADTAAEQDTSKWRIRYYVQMAAYNKPDSAIEWLLRNVEFTRTSNVRLENLFMLLSGPFVEMRQALEHLHRVRENYIDDAYLVKEYLPAGKENTYNVQLGAFDSKANAGEFRASVAGEVKRPLKVSGSREVVDDSEQELFEVHTPTLADRDRAVAVRDSINRNTGVEEAFLEEEYATVTGNLHYNVQVGAFSEQSNAREYREYASRVLDRQMYISSGDAYNRAIGKDLFRVHTSSMSDWREALSLRDSIRQATEIGSAVLNYYVPEQAGNLIYDAMLRIGTFESREKAEEVLEQVEVKHARTGIMRLGEEQDIYIVAEPDEEAFQIRALRERIQEQYPGLEFQNILMKFYNHPKMKPGNQ